MTWRRAGGRALGTGLPTPPARTCRATVSPERGQAAVELAMVLPFVILLLLAVVQVALLARDQILVVHASREGAREAAVDPAPDAARAAAVSSSTLDPGRLEITIEGRGEPGSRVRVTARYQADTSVPIVGAFVGSVRLEAATTMRVER